MIREALLEEGRSEGIIIAIHQIQKRKGLPLTPESTLAAKTPAQLKELIKILVEP